jgi:hypothetical protein
MRKHLFAQDEILLHTDAMDLQDNASLDMSALLGALHHTADGAVTGGIDAKGVLAGFTSQAVVSGTNVLVTVQPGSILYTVAADNDVTYRIATVRDAVTLTWAGSAVSTKKYAILEAVITETTDSANRQFRRDLSGRVVIQQESTPKLNHTVVTLRVRDGIAVPTAGTAYAPAIVSDALPLGLLYTATDGAGVVTTSAVVDLRKLYRANAGRLLFQSPPHVYVDPTKIYPDGGAVAVERTEVGFGSQTPLDYIEVVQRSNGNSPVGGAFVFDTSVPSGSNTFGYLYACRVHPRTSAYFLVLTTKAPDLDRNLGPALSIAVPAPWQSMTVSGSEARYLCPIFLGASGVRSGMETAGSRCMIGHNYPEVTMLAQADSVQFSLDLSSITPPNATGVEGILTIYYTTGGASALGATVEVHGVSVPFPNSTVTAAPGENAATITVPIPYTAFNLASGRALQLTVLSRGTSIGTFDVIFAMTGVTEMLRS